MRSLAEHEFHPVHQRAERCTVISMRSMFAWFTVIGTRVPASSRYSVVTPSFVSVVTPPPILPPVMPPLQVKLPPLEPPWDTRIADLDVTTGAMATSVYAPSVTLLITNLPD